MSAIVPVNEVAVMAKAVAASGLFGVKTADQAMALMLIAQAEGLHPAIAARDYHVINGRPALKADAMLARFQTNGGKVQWKAYTDTVVTGLFSHPQGGEVEITWSIEMARKAGLTGNQTWTKYPRQMLRARCISEGIRTVYPGVTVGVYTPEEVEDMKPAVNVTPEPPPPSKELSLLVDAINDCDNIDVLRELYLQAAQLDKPEAEVARSVARTRKAELDKRVIDVEVETKEQTK